MSDNGDKPHEKEDGEVNRRGRVGGPEENVYCGGSCCRD